MLDCWGRCQWTKKMLKEYRYISTFVRELLRFSLIKLVSKYYSTMSLSNLCCGEEASWLKSVQANSRSVNVAIVNKSLHRSCLTDPNLNRNQSCWIVLTSSTKLSLRFRPAARSFGAFSLSSLARSSFVQSCSVDLSALSQNWQIAIAHCLWRWVNRSLTCSFRIWMISHLIWKEEKKKLAC